MCVHTCTYPYIFSTSFNPKKNLCEELGSEAEPLSHITKPLAQRAVSQDLGTYELVNVL